MPERRKDRFGGKSEKEWREFGERMADKFRDRFERRARRGKIGFGLFLLVVGVFWLLKDMGYIPTLPFWPLVLIFFALFVTLIRI
jgi:fatty acid desaturase